MRLGIPRSVPAHLDDIGAPLEAQEERHSLLLGLLLASADRPRAGEAAPYLATVRDGDALVAAAMYTAWDPRRPLIIADFRDDAADAMPLLVNDVLARVPALPQVLAHDPVAARFAEAWSAATGASVALVMRERLHVLRAVEPVPGVPGMLRRATADDLDLVASWIDGFHADVFGETDENAARRQAEGRIARGEIYLWDDGEVRTMCGRARPTPRTESVNAVYTPRALRGRGYATAAVAALSRILLAEGKDACVLFTDLANPTSIAIYARIGYRPVRDVTQLRFIPRAE